MFRPTIALLIMLLSSAVLAQTLNGNQLHLAQGVVTTKDLMGSDDPRIEISLKEAVEEVREKSGGRVLSARTLRLHGMFVHRIKVLTPDNREETYDFEAGDIR
jgi:uncharacterized membrane protein YkoI